MIHRISYTTDNMVDFQSSFQDFVFLSFVDFGFPESAVQFNLD